ncbi:hypothetical protein Aduo_010888 [Ancylostoma duodenale]
MPNSTPMGMDHRHLAIWMWTHSQSLTDNSETSIESAASDGYGAATELGVFLLPAFSTVPLVPRRTKRRRRTSRPGRQPASHLHSLWSSSPIDRHRLLAHLSALRAPESESYPERLSSSIDAMLNTLMYVVLMMSYSGSIFVQLGYYILEEYCLEKFNLPNLEEHLQAA